MDLDRKSEKKTGEKHPIRPVGSDAPRLLELGIEQFIVGKLELAIGFFNDCIREENEWGNKDSEISKKAQFWLSKILNSSQVDYKKKTHSRKSSFGAADLSQNYASAKADDVTGIRKMNLSAVASRRASVLYVYNIYDIVDGDKKSFLKQVNTRVRAVGYGTVISASCFMSARHLFNFYRPSEFALYSRELGIFYSFELIEDGARVNDADYIIGKLEPMFGDEQMPNSMKMTMPPAGYCEVAVDCPDEEGPQVIDYYPDTFMELQCLTHFNTQPGYCGLPYIDPTGNMFAFHCIQSDAAIMRGFSHSAAGVSLEYIAQKSRVLKKVEQHFIVQDLEQIYRDDPFTEFSKALPALEEVEEEGERESVLGGTPPVKSWSSAVQGALLRFFNKGKAEFRHDITDSGIKYTFTIHHDIREKKNVFKFAQQDAPNKVKKKVVEVFSDIGKVIQDKNLRFCWWVSVYKTVESTEREPVQLVNPNGENVIQMGHKIPAICFWGCGVEVYKKIRIAEVEKNEPHKGKPARKQEEVKNKLAKINTDKRFTNSKPGYLLWGEAAGISDDIEKFMVNEDGTNYTFQTGPVNKSQGQTEKKVYGKYSDFHPEGFEWKPERGRISKSKRQLYNYRLVPIAANLPYFNDFSNLKQNYQIKLNGEWVALNDQTKVLWPKKFKQTTSSRLLKRVGTHFEIRVETKDWADAHKEIIRRTCTKNSVKINAGLQPDGFFYYSRKLQERKDHPTEILNGCITFLEKVDRALSPK